MQVIAVGIADYNIYELNYIASDRSLIYEIDDFDNLVDIVDEVLITVCSKWHFLPIMKNVKKSTMVADLYHFVFSCLRLSVFLSLLRPSRFEAKT